MVLTPKCAVAAISGGQSRRQSTLAMAANSDPDWNEF
jgi:hypothetical protein